MLVVSDANTKTYQRRAKLKIVERSSRPMKRLPHIKSLKRLRILNKPVQVADISAELDSDAYTDTWLLQAEKIQAKRLRRFRQQLAA